MKIKRLTLCFAVVATSACAGLAQTKATVDSPLPAIESYPNAWKEFASVEGHFSIRLPGNATRLSGEDAAPEVTGCRAKSLNTSYLVTSRVLPGSSINADFVKKSLDESRDRMLAARPGRKLLSEKEISLGSYSGREILTEDGSNFALMRSYVAESRLYEVALEAPKDVAFNNGSSAKPAEWTDLYKSIIGRLFDSFTVNGSSAYETKEMAPSKHQTLNNCLTVMGVAAPGAPSNGEKKGGDILSGRAIKLVTPTYSPLALAAHASGQIAVQVLIDNQGKVSSAHAVSGNPLLFGPAVAAARASEFTPPTFKGKPVCVSGVIIYNFVAQ